MKNKHVTELMADDVPRIPGPIFTVRGEHNIWHVYQNDKRLEPPFRNKERAELERAHHERSHAIRNRSTEQPDGIV